MGGQHHERQASCHEGRTLLVANRAIEAVFDFFDAGRDG